MLTNNWQASIKVRRANEKRTHLGVLFSLAGALVASKLAMRAKRRRIRFAFSRICCRGDSRIARFSFEIVFFGRSKPLPYQKSLYIPAKMCYNKLRKAVEK